MDDPPINLRRAEEVLSSAGLGVEVRSGVLEALPSHALGVLLYGSQARGDALQGSDIDLLVLRSEPAGSRRVGDANVSTYTADQLASARATLFGMHLARDGLVLHDTDGLLQRLIGSMGEPDPEDLLSRVRHLSAVLDCPVIETEAHLLGLSRLARYLLRTGTYALALKGGSPCFSVRELAERFHDPALVALLDSNRHGSVDSVAELDELKRRIGALVGGVVESPFPSLASLIVSEWDSDPHRASLAALALRRDDSTLDYSALDKVIL